MLGRQVPKGDDQTGVGELKKLALDNAGASQIREPCIRADCRNLFKGSKPLRFF